MCIYIYSPYHSLLHYGLSQGTEYGCLCPTVGPVAYPSYYNSLHLLPPNSSPFPVLLPPPSWPPQVCSLGP